MLTYSNPRGYQPSYRLMEPATVKPKSSASSSSGCSPLSKKIALLLCLAAVAGGAYGLFRWLTGAKSSSGSGDSCGLPSYSQANSFAFNSNIMPYQNMSVWYSQACSWMQFYSSVGYLDSNPDLLNCWISSGATSHDIIPYYPGDISFSFGQYNSTVIADQIDSIEVTCQGEGTANLYIYTSLTTEVGVASGEVPLTYNSTTNTHHALRGVLAPLRLTDVQDHEDVLPSA